MFRVCFIGCKIMKMKRKKRVGVLEKREME